MRTDDLISCSVLLMIFEWEEQGVSKGNLLARGLGYQSDGPVTTLSILPGFN